MVVVGGVTRLTESGLSMTDWKPLVGVRLLISLLFLYRFVKKNNNTKFQLEIRVYNNIFFF